MIIPESEKIYSLIKQVSLVLITCMTLFVYFALLPMIKFLGLPKGAEILIQIAIVFAIIFTVIIAILGNIYEDQKIKEKEEVKDGEEKEKNE